MSLNWPKTGINYAPAYQVSGIPFVTSSVDNELTTGGNVVRVKFPFVTSTIRVEASGSTAGNSAVVRFGFTENGVNSNPDANYGLVFSSGGNNYGTPELPLRCSELYLKLDSATGRSACGFVVVAGLTNIETGQLGTLTGSVNGTIIPIFQGVG